MFANINVTTDQRQQELEMEMDDLQQIQMNAKEVLRNEIKSDSIHLIEMESNEILQNRMESCELHQEKMESSETRRNHIETNGIQHETERSETLENGMESCRLHPIGIESGRLHLIGVESSEILQNEMESSRILQNEMESSEILQNEMESSRILQSEMESSEILQNEMESSGILQNEMESSGILQNEMESSEMLKNEMESSGIQREEMKSRETEWNDIKSNEIQQETERSETRENGMESCGMQSGENKSRETECNDMKSYEILHEKEKSEPHKDGMQSYINQENEVESSKTHKDGKKSAETHAKELNSCDAHNHGMKSREVHEDDMAADRRHENGLNMESTQENETNKDEMKSYAKGLNSCDAHNHGMKSSEAHEDDMVADKSHENGLNMESTQANETNEDEMKSCETHDNGIDSCELEQIESTEKDQIESLACLQPGKHAKKLVPHSEIKDVLEDTGEHKNITLDNYANSQNQTELCTVLDNGDNDFIAEETDKEQRDTISDVTDADQNKIETQIEENSSESPVPLRDYKDENFFGPHGALNQELSEEILSELDEDPEIRAHSIEIIRDWINENTDFYGRTDVNFILRYLRLHKYDIETVKKRIMKTYDNRHSYPNYFLRSEENENVVEAMLKQRTMYFMNYAGNSKENLIICHSNEFDFKKFPLDSSVGSTAVQITEIVVEDPRIQVYGTIFVGDFSQITFNTVWQVTPAFISRMVNLLTESMPMRIKGIHVINASWMANSILSLFKLFLSEKLRSRLFIHRNMESLYEHVSPNYLPLEFGGSAGPIQKFVDSTIKLYRDGKEVNDKNQEYGVGKHPKPPDNLKSDLNELHVIREC